MRGQETDAGHATVKKRAPTSKRKRQIGPGSREPNDGLLERQGTADGM